MDDEFNIKIYLSKSIVWFSQIIHKIMHIQGSYAILNDNGGKSIVWFVELVEISLSHIAQIEKAFRNL